MSLQKLHMLVRSQLRSQLHTWVLAVAVISAACTIPAIKSAQLAPDLSGAASPPSAALLNQQLTDDARLDDIGAALLRAAAPQCAEGTRRAGFRFANAPTFTRRWESYATALGYTDTVQVVSVAKRGGADRAGLRAADRIVSIDGVTATPGSGIVESMRTRVTAAAARGAPSVNVTVRREGRESAYTVPLDSSCAMTFMSWRDDAPDAWSDGRTIAVTTGMIAYAHGDGDMAVVLAHEIAHAIIRRGTAHTGWDRFLDATADVATGAVGYATDDRWARMKRARPENPADDREEQRADDLTQQLLVQAGHRAPMHDFWRRLQLPDPASFPYARKHPLSMARIIRMDDRSTSH